MLLIGMCSLSAEDVRPHRFILFSGGLIFLLVACQLIPLPPSVWQMLPDRDLLRQIDDVTGTEQVWRPMTIAPLATYSALWGLVPPLACLVLAVQLELSALTKLVYLLFSIVIVTAIWALVQMAGEPGGALYLYDVTNRDLPVGIFANRNHQAVFLACTIPMLAYILEQNRYRWNRGGGRIPIRVSATALGAFIAILIIVTGSRTGLLLGLLSIASMFLFTRHQAEHSARESWFSLGAWKRRSVLAFGLVGMIVVLSLVVYAGRDIAVQRLVRTDEATELRAQILPSVIGMIEKYLPWGAGQGSFEQIYLIHEPERLLSPVYMNHVHNDWLEIVLEGGAPIIIMVFVCLAWLLHAVVLSCRKGWRDPRSQNLGRLGLFLILLLGLASLTDYPLRVPSLACVAALALVWISKMKAEGKMMHSRLMTL